MKSKHIKLIRLLCILCLLAIWQPVLAHGGGQLYVSNQPISDYSVSVWVNPPDPKANQEIHLTVGIGGKQLEPVLDVQVFVTLFDGGTGQPVASAPATTEQSSNRLFYETDFPSVEAGEYEVVVDINGADGVGNVSFPLTIKPTGLTTSLYVGVGLVGVITAVIILRSWRKQTHSTHSGQLSRRKK